MWMDLDYVQTYLIGLKYYATGAWPYFGPDVNGAESSFQSQIPGAMEGLLIGLPFHVLPIPESPYILLNLLSAAGVMLLAWYICARLPGISYIWLCLWIMVAPWSINEASIVINPAYTFLPGILFFIGFMESAPSFRLDLFPAPLANALMGFSIFWIMQFHFTYVYLLPLAAYSLLAQAWKTRRISCLLYFALGSLPTLAFLAPTYFKYGLERNNVASGFAMPFCWANVKAFGIILARFLSIVCFELPRYIGLSTRARIGFLFSHPLILLPGAFLWIAGLLQPFILLAGWFFKKPSGPRWPEMKWLVLAIFLMAEVSFWFTIKKPLSHLFFIFFPFLMAYSCYVWLSFADQKRWRVLAKVFVAAGILFQLGYAFAVKPDYSIYTVVVKPGQPVYDQRALVVKAIQEKDYRILGERRPGSFY
jgi:hypothetical protein